jgi:plasmid stabilization system protein ParE
LPIWTRQICSESGRPESAQADLVELRSYIVKNFSVTTWQATYAKLKLAIRNLATFPQLGGVPDELETLNLTQYRQILSGKNRIIYEVRQDAVYIHLIIIRDGFKRRVDATFAALRLSHNAAVTRRICIMRILLFAAAAMFALPAMAANTPPRNLVPEYDQAGLTRMCDAGLATARKAIEAMAARRAAGAIFEEWNRLAMVIDDVAGPVDLLVNVHPVKAVRDAGEVCLQKIVMLNTELFQNEAVFQRVRKARASNPYQAKLQKDLVAGFEDSGVMLAAPERERAKEIFDKLTQLDQAFQRNVREAPMRVTFRPEELVGLPATSITALASSRDQEGNYVLKAASYASFLRNAKDEMARKRFYIARQNRGGTANLHRARHFQVAPGARLFTDCHRSQATRCVAKWLLSRDRVEVSAEVKAVVTVVEKRERGACAAKANDTERRWAKQSWSVGTLTTTRKRYAVSVSRSIRNCASTL